MIFATLNTIIEDLINIIRGSEVSASEPISKRQVEDWIHQYRAVLISRDIDKKNYANPDYIQEIPILAVEAAIEEGGTYRTVLELPSTIDLNYKSGLTWVGDTTGKEYQFDPQKRFAWRQYKKYTSGDPIAFLKDKKMYTNTDANISVRGIFENPMEVGRFINPNTNLPYADLDTKYPMPNNLIPSLKEMILKGELGVEMKSPNDEDNDSKHSV